MNLLSRYRQLEELAEVVYAALSRAETISGGVEACSVGSTISRHKELVYRVVGYAPKQAPALERWAWQYKQEPDRWGPIPEPQPRPELRVFPALAAAGVINQRKAEVDAARKAEKILVETLAAAEAAGVGHSIIGLLRKALEEQRVVRRDREGDWAVWSEAARLILGWSGEQLQQAAKAERRVFDDPASTGGANGERTE